MPLAWPAAGWTAGIAATRVDAFPLAWLPWLAALAVVLLLARRWRILAAWLLAGMLWGGIQLVLDARLAHVDSAWLSKSAPVSARVSAVRSGPGYARLKLTDVCRLSGGRCDRTLGGAAWLYVHGGQTSRFRPGDRIEARARWRLPRNHRNPGGFDFRAWCFDRHLALIGSARGPVRIVARNPSLFQRARERIRRAMAGLPRPEAGVLKALALADRSDLTVETEQVFAVTGTMHLLAISGLHVGMAAGLGFALCWWLLTRREAWIVAVPVRGMALLAGLVVAVGYAMLAGWPLPARRAALMLAGGVAAWWMRSAAPPLNTLLGALMLMLLLDAASVGSLSLWLSFAATAAILVWTSAIDDRSRAGWFDRLRRSALAMLTVTAAASLATLPLTADAFGRLPLYGLPANLLAVPLYGLFILPLTLAGAALATTGLVAAAAYLFALAGHGVAWGLAALGWIASLPFAVIWTVALPHGVAPLTAATMVAAGIWAWRGRRGPAMALAVAIFTVWAGAVVRERPPAQTMFAAWDVGQGASSALMLPDGHVLAVDAPGRRGSRFNGGVIAAEALRAMGLTHVDVLAATHAQSDHMGGMTALIARLNHVGELWLPDVPAARRRRMTRELVAAARKQGVVVRWLARGDVVRLGSITVRALWPPRGHAPANPNNASLVLSLAMPDGKRLLLPGDVEARAERSMVRAGIERHTLALLPHHGSATSSTPAFVRAVHPALAIAQTGAGNRYGFPNPEVIRRWQGIGATVINTADGAVLVDLSGARATWRHAPPVQSARRAWALRLWQRG